MVDTSPRVSRPAGSLLLSAASDSRPSQRKFPAAPPALRERLRRSHAHANREEPGGGSRGRVGANTCPPTRGVSRPSACRSPAPGSMRFGPAVNEMGRPGRGCMCSPSDDFPNPVSSTPGRASASTFGPKAGAECGSSASSGLCGGRPKRKQGPSLPRSAPASLAEPTWKQTMSPTSQMPPTHWRFPPPIAQS